MVAPIARGPLHVGTIQPLRWNSTGPAVYRNWRVGQEGKAFSVKVPRTMIDERTARDESGTGRAARTGRALQDRG